MTIHCVLCPATEPTALAALAHGWTPRVLAEPVTYRSVFGHGLPPTPAGEHSLCATCSAWLDNHRDRMLPVATLNAIDATIAAGGELHPTTERRLRMELVGMVRHLAEALTTPGTVPDPLHRRKYHRGELRGRPQPDGFAREADE
ncbi:hypothetical protein AB0N38_11605 [Micromonospora aurantiaca]|uniref:hypothetical protein n=1 Tax=Micromonospora aurantiaca (nom. illeg.) TaxID=47850 RepID=UPI003420C25C